MADHVRHGQLESAANKEPLAVAGVATVNLRES